MIELDSVDAMQRATETSDDMIIEFLTAVSAQVEYRNIAQEDGEFQWDKISIPEFVNLRTLAMIDMFDPRKDEEIKPAITVPKTPRQLRNHPFYKRVKEEVRAQAERVARTDTMMAASEELEPIMVGKMRHLALTGSDREKAMATKEFLDRQSAKVGREGGERVIYFQPGFLENLEKTAKILEQHRVTKQVEGEVIDAGKLNTPDV